MSRLGYLPQPWVCRIPKTNFPFGQMRLELLMFPIGNRVERPIAQESALHTFCEQGRRQCACGHGSSRMHPCTTPERLRVLSRWDSIKTASSFLVRLRSGKAACGQSQAKLGGLSNNIVCAFPTFCFLGASTPFRGGHIFHGGSALPSAKVAGLHAFRMQLCLSDATLCRFLFV